MASFKHARWWVVVGILSAAPFQLAQAQELDRPSECWQAILSYLSIPVGTSIDNSIAYAALDSTYILLPAVNAAIRRVAVDIGVTAFDTLTVAANTFSYALNTDFMQIQDGDKPAIPFNATRISSNTKTISGMKQTPLSEFGTVVGGTGGVQTPTSEAVGFSVTGRTMWIYPAGTVGDKIYVTGPADGIPVTHGADTTNIYNADMPAVVYYATSLIAKARGSEELANDMMLKYVQHVQSRTGRTPVTQGAQ